MDLNGIKILIVDDELDIQEFIQYNLVREGAVIETSSNGKLALDKIDSFKPDLVLLDIMMPEMDGVEFCRIVRTKKELEHVIICFLTARSEDYSQIAALDLGGDDYITKPIRPKVLVSRLKALLRRHDRTSATKFSTVMQLGDLKIDQEQILVFKKEEKITLAKKEFELLCLLASKPGKVFGREEIFRKIWGEDVIVGHRTIDVHVRKVREKVGQDYIKTVKGIGYKFEF